MRSPSFSFLPELISQCKARRLSVLFATALLAIVAFPAAAEVGDPSQWLFAGHDRHNTRFARREFQINPGNVGALSPAWAFTAGAEVVATPAVENGMVYLPDKAGNFYKVNATTGALVWQRRIADYTGVPPAAAGQSVSRTTPAISGYRMVIGTRDGYLLAIDKFSGSLIWRTRVDAHPAARVTASAVIDDGRVYVGVTSGEESLAANPNYPCAVFAGVRWRSIW